MKDIFLSYRRKDAETEAYLLYKDLVRDGYSVFFDHKTLGGGDFRKAIETQIKYAKDVIIVFSKSSLGKKIFDENDVYRNEIYFALKYKKRIVGVMLEDFPGFPDNLPDEINSIRNINCLKLHIGYYDEMYARLVSGRFLVSVSEKMKQQLPSEEAVHSKIPRELVKLSMMEDSKKMQYTQMLLQIMDSFNNSKECMRFYQYLDMFERKKGIDDLKEYDGNIPTDLVTYLSFFETLYIIVGSRTLDISVIDFAYRFRFFAGCNIPIMQESELLPLGYQYPNIMSLYNLWCDYIVEQHEQGVKCERLSDIIPLYEYDLHKRYAAYCYANKPVRPMKIRFLNRELRWLNLTMRTMQINDFEDSMELQKRMLDNISDNEEKNLFEPLTEEEMKDALNKEICVGLYTDEKLAAQMNLLVNLKDEESIAFDLNPEYVLENAAVIDSIIVDASLRGYGIQKTLLFVAECMAKNYGKSGLCAVVSPLNAFSIKNFISQGYEILDTRPKYRSIRHYFWKEIKLYDCEEL